MNFYANIKIADIENAWANDRDRLMPIIKKLETEDRVKISNFLKWLNKESFTNKDISIDECVDRYFFCVYNQVPKDIEDLP